MSIAVDSAGVATVSRSRHPATAGMLRWFEYEHLPMRLQIVSIMFYRLAHGIADTVPDGPELTTALRKLLEAKDCAVRASVDG